MDRYIDTVFKWRCARCGRIFEEGNMGMLEARKRTHVAVCGSPRDYTANTEIQKENVKEDNNE